MSRLGMTFALTMSGFPRVSGDEPRSPLKWLRRPPFSPRERG